VRPRILRHEIVGSRLGNRSREQFSGDPPLPVARLTPATGHRVNFLQMKNTILLADGDPAVRRMLSRLLAEENYFVVSAQNADQMFEVWSHSPVDLVLLDLDVPEKNGWEMFQRFRTLHPAIAIIAITSQPNQIFPALASGVGALMEKPLDLPKLLRVIRDLVDEPSETRRARMEGRPVEFRYLPPKRNESVEVP